MHTKRLTPQIAAIALTQRCNLACSHCGSPAPFGRGEISRRELRNLFSQFTELGVRQVILSGGEPLLRKDLFEIIGDVGDAGLSCALLTNGTLLTRAKLKRLKATGVVDYLRLSVEYPEKQPVPPGSASVFHNTQRTLDIVRMAADFAIPAGVNMTLLPDNLRYVQELAAASKSAGAAFFRALPLLPTGRSASADLPPSFHAACIAAMLPIHAASRNPDAGKGGSKLSMSRVRSFLAPCGAGAGALSITADGRMHICSMADLGGKPVYLTDNSVADCLRMLSRRRSYLQRKIVAAAGGCRTCKYAPECRGGCLAEWAVRGSGGGQPCCVRKTWSDVVAACGSDRTLTDVAAAIVDEYALFLQGNPPIACLRALPYWVVYFG